MKANQRRQADNLWLFATQGIVMGELRCVRSPTARRWPSSLPESMNVGLELQTDCSKEISDAPLSVKQWSTARLETTPHASDPTLSERKESRR